MIDNKYLKNEERVIYALRSLYGSYGYLPFTMSKFEEYELYVKNKDFLVSDGVITFTDTNGKLLALKPDVTLSIIKNGQDEPGTKQKVYYSENVYRISGSTRQFKEIMQAGLECIGDIDLYDVYEVVTLACTSLESISESYVLEISHLGVLSALLDSINSADEFKNAVMECIKQKNAHEIKKLCTDFAIDDEKANILCEFVGIYGKADAVLEKLYGLNISDDFVSSVNELKAIVDLLNTTRFKDRIQLDFSLVNDMNYYNGIVFNGFIEGVCETVLFGGRYDGLLNKMGREAKGIGFAIYVDLLENMSKEARAFDVDVLVLYDNISAFELGEIVNSYVAKGRSVTTQKEVPSKIRYNELVDLRGEARK